MNINDYIKSPCRVSSIPYWKTKSIQIPEQMLIVHDNDFVPDAYLAYEDEIYFRLWHDLQDIGDIEAKEVKMIDAAANMLDIFVEMINASYTNLSVTKSQLERYMKTPVYRPELWLLLQERSSKRYIGSAIADYDQEVGELVIEWVQVLPTYRNRGYGTVLVNNLLSRMKGIANFATVSGKVDNPTHPEKLYRKCGFNGNDLWHVLRKRCVTVENKSRQSSANIK